ncbi:MAG: branched-chain amino acid ABC transporter permease [Bacillota bacterium]
MDAAILIQALATGITMGCVYALVSVGLSLIYGIMDIINFAHGELLMVGMFAAFWLWAIFGLDPLLSLPLVAMLMALIGALINVTIIRPVYKSTMLAQIFVTFGLATLLSSSAQALFTANFHTIDNSLLAGNVDLGGIYLGRPELFAGLISLVAFIGLYLFLRKTKTGRALQATSENKDAAALMGINTEKMFTLGWAISIGCVGIAASVLASYYYIFPGVGTTFSLIAYVAVALGGFGNVLGAFVGGVIIGAVEALSGVLISPVYKYPVVFVVYLLVVLLRPQGILGKS